MADLSEHLGRGGELVVLLFFFALLLSMHAPLRRHVIERAHAAYRGGGNAVISARRRSETIRNWTDALRLSIQDRSGYFLIVIALVVFDYFDTYVLNDTRIANLIHGAPDWSVGITGRYQLTIYALQTFTFVGYALFGWLAFKRAQGVDFQLAARFTPLRDVVLFFIFTAAIEVLAKTLAPMYLFLQFVDGVYLAYVAKTVLFSCALASVSAYLLFFIRQSAKWTHIASAVVGYLILTHVLQIYNTVMHTSFLGALYIAFELSMDFLITVLWTIFFVAFCILLGQSVQRENT